MSQSAMPIDVPLQRADSKSRRQAVLYCVAAFLYWVALYLYVPTLPTYVQTKTNDLAMVGVVLSMFGLWQALFRLPLGIVSDWLGWRKPFIILCLALTGLGAWILGSASDVNGLLVGRAVTGLACGTWVPLVVAFSSLFEPREAIRATAIMAMIGSIGKALATAATGPLNVLSGGYSLAYFLAAGVAGLAIVVVALSREKRLPRKSWSAGSVASVVTRPDVFFPTLLTAVLQYVTFASVYGYLPILAEALGADDVAVSVLTFLNLALNLGGNLLATRLVARFGTRRTVSFGVALLVLGAAGAAVAPGLSTLYIVQPLLGFGMGLAYPVLMGMAIEQVGDSERATAMGLFQSLYAVGMFAGPWLSGILARAMGIQPMFGVTAFGCMVIAALVILKLGRRS